jgi:hypothetical protein
MLEPVGRDGVALILEHPRIPFASFPYEWTPGMLAEAGRLTLELAETVSAEGWGLKDATPFNVLFQGPRPIFVDLLSFERRDPTDATWLPYAQFVRTFLLPLLAHRHFGLSMRQVFSVRRRVVADRAHVKIHRLPVAAYQHLQKFGPTRAILLLKLKDLGPLGIGKVPRHG